MDRKIILYFNSVDSLEGWTEEFDTIEEAVSHFYHKMGKTYEIGSCYAVNVFGDMTCSVEGATWKEMGLE